MAGVYGSRSCKDFKMLCSIIELLTQDLFGVFPRIFSSFIAKALTFFGGKCSLHSWIPQKGKEEKKS